MARYGKGAKRSVKRAMHKRKKGTLKSGKSGRRVKAENRPSRLACRKPDVKGIKYLLSN